VPKAVPPPEATLGKDLGGDAVGDAHEGSEGEVDGLSGLLALVRGDGGVGGVGDVAGDDLGGALLGGLLLLLGLLVGDLPRGLAVGELLVFVDGFCAGVRELLELIHDEGGGDAGGGSDEEAAKQVGLSG